MKIITFMSDFGIKSGYVAQMKGVALSKTYARIVDITHEITPHNVREGAFVLQTVISKFPAGTVHVAVVDPGVGSDRKGIVVVTRSQILIGPDNGLLIPAAKSLGDFIVYEIDYKNLIKNEISNTFHGRDIFTPVACQIINERPFEQIGPIINDYINLDLGNSEINLKTANGNVIYIDSFGNIITNIDGSKLKQKINFNDKIMVFIDKKQKKMSFVKSYSYVKKGEFCAIIGSSNYLEISQNQGDAAIKLNVKQNDEIKILFG